MPVNPKPPHVKANNGDVRKPLIGIYTSYYTGIEVLWKSGWYIIIYHKRLNHLYMAAGRLIKPLDAIAVQLLTELHKMIADDPERTRISDFIHMMIA